MADPRSTEEIERDLARARDDLSQRVSSLDREVRARVDVKARARVTAQKARQRARDGADRASAAIRAHPDEAVVIAALAGLGLGLLIGGRRAARARPLGWT